MFDIDPSQGEDLELRELMETHQLLLEEERRKGLDSLYFFDKHILGYKEMMPRTHRPVCEFIENKEYRKKHLELSRGGFKSSIITIGYSIQTVAKNPDIRILIDNEVYGNSKSFLREIKGHMDSPKIQELYPELIPDKQVNEGWTESSVIVKAREHKRKEPTISCAGVDQIKVGMHYDLIIMDDLVSNRNVTTKEQMDKVIDHYKLALSLLEPDGELIIVGTRYNYSDLYGYILDNEKDLFKHLIIPAVMDEEAIKGIKELTSVKYDYQEGDLFFPERITKQFLDNQKTSQGSYIFNCQYMLNPVNAEESDFSEAWIKYYRGFHEITPEGHFLVVEWVGDYKKQADPTMKVPFRVPVSVYTTWDPANKKKKKTDFTGSSSIAVDPRQNWFILNMVRDKFNPKEIVDRIIHEHDIFEAIMTGIEENGKDTIKFYLLETMRKLNKFFRMKELKTGGTPKVDRIKRLIPRFENGMIFLPLTLYRKTWDGKTVDVIEAFLNEYMYFPLSKNDDLIDALAYQEDMVPRKSLSNKGRRKGNSRIIR